MENNKYKPRKKAFVGAVIGAVGSIAGGIISARKKKKEAAREADRQRAIAKNQEIVQSTNALNVGLEGQEELQKNFISQYMKYGGSVKSSKYKSRNKKAIGGIGEIIGGVIGGVSSITGAATGIPEIGAAGNAVGAAVGQGISNYNNKRIQEQREANLKKEVPMAGIPKGEDFVLPDKLPFVKKYGGRHMKRVIGSKPIKTKPTRI